MSTKHEGQDSRTADKFVVRLKPSQRDKVKARAQADNRSMNDTMVDAIDRYLEQGEAFDELLRIVQQATQPQAGAFVTIHRSYLQQLVKAVIEMDEDNATQGREFMVAALAVLGGDV